jgi:hypothetical protein
MIPARTKEQIQTVLSKTCPRFTVAQKFGMVIASVLFVASVVMLITLESNWKMFAIPVLVISIGISIASVFVNYCVITKKVYNDAMNLSQEDIRKQIHGSGVEALTEEQLSRLNTSIDNQRRLVR